MEAQIYSFSSKKYAFGIFLLHLSVMKLYTIQILRAAEQQWHHKSYKHTGIQGFEVEVWFHRK